MREIPPYQDFAGQRVNRTATGKLKAMIATRSKPAEIREPSAPGHYETSR
jgi:hypothetical protein